MAKKRCLLLGAGWMGRVWIRDLLPQFADRLEVAGLVDIDEHARSALADFLRLAPRQQFSDMATAFAEVDADFCIIVIPPSAHKQAVMHAVRRHMPVLSEKPIADTWEDCLSIYAAVKGAGLKMMVIQNYRYTTPILTMRHLLLEGDLGRINYIVARFAADYRAYGSWAAPFRHEIPHGLLIEGGVHHFDTIRNLSGADCASIAGWEWNPPWSSSKGEFCNLYLMHMTNDVRVSYEGSGTAAGTQNFWYEEAYRAECEHGAVAVGQDQIVRLYRSRPGRRLVVEEVAPLTPAYQRHLWQIDEFLNWLDGGPTPATVIDDNIKTAAMVFAAIEASRTKRVVNVTAMLKEGSRG